MLRFIKSSADLVTSREAVRQGFLGQALAKTVQAEPYVAQARRFKKLLDDVASADAAVEQPTIRTDVLAAAGFSDKALNHLSGSELVDALEAVVSSISRQHPDTWRDELLFRFLLTRGDSLGGRMRNFTGARACSRFATALVAALDEQGKSPSIRRSNSNADKIQAILWDDRILLFDKTARFIGKNIDAILLGLRDGYDEKGLLSNPATFIACGELKGGIDPAGADEHWKTASSALDRIRRAFLNNCPKLFFVGAAIEVAMAEEIFAQLKDGRLEHAANLNVPAQLADLASWLASL